MQTIKKNTPSVLIIEDSRVQRDIIRKMLHFTPYQVTAVGGGAKALSLIKGEKTSFDLILLDLEMPNLSGVDTIRELRKLLGPKSKTMIIAVTGNKREFLAKDFKGMTFNAAIIKPINVRELISLMDRILEKEPGCWEGVIQSKGISPLF